MRILAGAMAVIISLHALTPRATADIAAGQVNDFEQGGTQGWQEGLASPNPPQVVPDGGPQGAGDAYLENRSSGLSGAGGKMVYFNTQQEWQGDYIDAGITALELDMNNMGNLPLTMRFRILGPGGDIFTQGVPILPGSGWQRVSFSLGLDDLLPAGVSTANKTRTLENVNQLWLINNTSPSDPGPSVNAVLGIDNITAVGPPVIEPLAGDYNGNGRVEQADLDLVLLNWGTALDQPWVDATVDQAELDGVLLNWGNEGPLAAAAAAAVPEPSAIVLLLATAAAVGLHCRGAYVTS